MGGLDLEMRLLCFFSCYLLIYFSNYDRLQGQSQVQFLSTNPLFSVPQSKKKRMMRMMMRRRVRDIWMFGESQLEDLTLYF